MAIDEGYGHCLTLLADGSVRVWGVNDNGQIGDNTTGAANNRFVPVTPVGLDANAAIKVTQIAAGYQHSAALRTDGSVLTWGDDSFGQLGDGAAGADTLTPTAIGINQVTDVKSSLGLATYARKRDGSIFAWGFNTGNAQICLKVNNVIDQNLFNRLTILHDDNLDGVLDAVTVTRNYQKREVCRVTSSCSPFVLAQALAPLAATVSVSGRVIVGKDTGLRNAVVTLTDINGNTRQAISSSFGYYKFDDVEAGAAYFVSVRSKQYFFETQIVNPTEDIGNMDFFAQTPFGGLKGR